MRDSMLHCCALDFVLGCVYSTVLCKAWHVAPYDKTEDNDLDYE